MEWTVNVHRTAESCTAQSRLTYTYYSLGSYTSLQRLYELVADIFITASSSMYA